MTKKIDYQKLEKDICSAKKSAWEVWGDETKKECFAFSQGYKDYLNKSKTESEAIRETVAIARKKGFKELSRLTGLKAGDKIYIEHRGKSLILGRIGKKGLSKGVKILMAHLDSPHLDFKASPLYEDESIAFLKTHYYGGIKKYQWPTIALALHGTVYLSDGKNISLVIGENEDDPVFMITDLLPHLDRAGGPGSAIKGREVKGEDLNLVVGSMPVPDIKIKEKVKLAVIGYLFEKYGIREDDLSSMDLQAVPSEKARDLGFDRSMISAYGHDDKVCTYASLRALLEAKQSDKTQLCILIDREEIGSEGNTGAQSVFIEAAVADMLGMLKQPSGIADVYRIFARSKAISADVTAAMDPDYKDVHDPRNSARLGYGVALEKYTGSGGKYSSSEASAEFIRELKSVFSKNKDICYQIGGGLGKIDVGGGGTIAKYMANRNMDIVDMGVPLFNMHAPLEIASKADIFCAYLAYRTFLEY